MAEERETDPLLSCDNSRQSSSSSTTESQSGQQSTDNNDKPIFRHTLRVIVLIASVLLISDLAGYAAFAPQLDIYEGIICRQYYSTSDHIDREKCKVEPVQSELALINGWSDTFPTIPGILLALPYGALADQIGRKPVLLLGMIGCLLGEAWIRIVCWLSPIIPIRAVWFSALSPLIGGGAQTVSSLMFVMIADICSVERRTTAFSQLSAAVLIPEVIAVPISAALMSYSSWLPFMISYALYLIGFSIALCVPETLQAKRKELLLVDETTPLQGNKTKFNREHILDRFRVELLKVQTSISAVRRDSNIILVLFCFLISCLGRQAIPLILQYGPKKFHWTIAQTSYLMSLRGSVNLLLLFVLLPAISEFLSAKLKLDPSMKDKRLTQGGMTLLLAGSALIFFAASPAVFVLGLVIRALGSSFQITARSLITSMVDQHLLGTVYTAIAAVTSAGMLVAGPLMAYTFKWGMLLDGIWLGMPFLVAAGLYAVGLLLISLTRLDR